MSRRRCWRICTAGQHPPGAVVSKATIGRLITDAGAEVYDATVGRRLTGRQAARQRHGTGGGDPAGLVPVRLYGKTVRDAGGNQRHLQVALLGPAAQAPVTAAQAGAGAKTNEVPMATEVLGQTDPNGKIVAADALHTVTATAEFICDHGGEFMLPAKENRKTLFDALPWEQVQVAHAECSIGTNPQPDLADPHAAQIGGSRAQRRRGAV